MEFHRGSIFRHFPAIFKALWCHIKHMEGTMLQPTILPDTTPGATQLFPLSPEAVRALRNREDATRPTASEPAKEE
jgi:hypothetical protein